MRTVYCFLLAIGLGLPAAAARDIYVNNAGGDDHYTGDQPRAVAGENGPVRTIARALRLAQSGDRIVLADTRQPYRESISVVGARHSGDALRPMTIEGNGAVLDGSVAVGAEQWEFYRDNRFRFRPPQMGACLLLIDGRIGAPVASAPGAEVPPKLEPRQWCSHQGYIYFGVEQSKLPAAYAPAYTGMTAGITLYQVDRVVIKDLTVRGFRIDGIHAAAGARHVTLQGVTCVNNGRAGIAAAGASQVYLDSCQANANGKAQLLSLPNSTAYIRNSELSGDSAPAWVDQGGRVFLGDQPVRGGRDVIRREDAKPLPKAEPKAAEPHEL